MTQEDFCSELEKTKIPVFYNRAKKGTKVPFIVYTFVRVPDLLADNKAYSKKYNATVELMTNSKTSLNECSIALEEILDTIAPYYVTEAWNDDEQIYINSYDMEI